MLDLEEHHVVPKSLGGKQTVMLCSVCHGKVHGLKRPVSSATLTRRALAVKRARGEKTGGTVPYGWDAVPSHAGAIGLVENAQEQAEISRIVQEREGGCSYAAIARRLNEDGVPTKTGAHWHPETVRGIMHGDTTQGEG